jgi:hypothetical protein
VSTNPLDQTIVVRTELRIRTSASRRFEQYVNGLIERSAGSIEVTLAQLPLASLEVPFRKRNEFLNRIALRLRRRSRRKRRYGRGHLLWRGRRRRL